MLFLNRIKRLSLPYLISSLITTMVFFTVFVCSFSLVNSSIFKQLETPEPDKLVLIESFIELPNGMKISLSNRHLTTNIARELNRNFDVYHYLATEEKINENEQVTVGYIADGLLKRAGFNLLSGNTFSSKNSSQEAIVTSGFVSQFAPDKNNTTILGDTIVVGNNSYKVAGVIDNSVLNYDFLSNKRVQLYVPFSLAGLPDDNPNDFQNSLKLLASVKAGATVKDLENLLLSFVSKNTAVYSNGWPPQTVFSMDSTSIKDKVIEPIKEPVISLLVLSIMLIALIAFTYTQFEMAHAYDLAPNYAVMKSLGSTNSDIFKRVLYKKSALLLSAIVLALPFVLYLNDKASSIIRYYFDVELVISIDLFGFVAAVFILLVLLYGLSVLHLRIATHIPLAHLLKGASKGSATYIVNGWTVKALVTAQLMIALFLTTTSSAITSYNNVIRSASMGISPNQLNELKIDISELNYSTGTSESLMHQLLIGLNDSNKMYSKLSSPIISKGFTISSISLDDNEFRVVLNSVAKNFFELTQLHLIAGEMPQSKSKHQLVISNSLAKKLANTPADAVGLFVKKGDNKIQIVGVVEDVERVWLEEDFSSQIYSMFDTPSTKSISLLYHDAIKNTINVNLDALLAKFPQIKVLQNASIEETKDVLDSKRLITLDTSIFIGFLTVFLIFIGIAGRNKHDISTYKQELSIRLALGQRRFDILSIFILDHVR